MIPIWYILFCPGGDEEEIIRSCRQHLTATALDDVFTFTYDCMKRYEGAWHTETHPMFPGYVFIESSHEEQLSGELKQYRNIVRVLEDRDTLFRVYPEEEMFLKSLCGANHHMRMSRGYIRDGITCVTEGPLKGREHMIRRIDRHKRLARLETSIIHRPREVQAGLEIIAKS